MITLDSLDLQKISPQELGELLIEAKKAYYTTGKPIMDDHTFDTLEEILRQKNPYHRIFQKVGTPNFDTGWLKKSHIHPMTSQNKVTTYQDLVHYFELKKIPPKTDFIAQPKCDGLSLEIIYQNGRLIDAITRGDGQIGDCITQNVVKMQNFVTRPRHFSGSVRCEIVVTNSDFKKLNQVADEKYSNSRNAASGLPAKAEPLSNQYSNPRNAAAGLSQRLDSKYAEFCSLYAVDLIADVPTENEKVKLLKQLGFTPVESHLCHSFSDIETIYQRLNQHRLDYPFDIDGVVVKINNTQLAQKLGSRDNRPKSQVAYKFPAAVNQTRLLSVDWQTGPLGTVTPVAKIEPVEISGAIITYISLANLDIIKQLNLNIGDIIEVSRRGDVIPHIEKIITKVNPGHLSPPKTCSSCHHHLVADHKFLKCPNRFGCPAQTLGILRLFCQTLDIKGISDKTIEKLVAADKVKLPGDFYQLTVNDFINLDGLGQKSGTNIVNEIQPKRRLTLIQAFDAAIIPNFSAKRIKLVIAAGFDTPQKLLHLRLDDLLQIPGFKTTLATKIIDGLTSRRQVIKSILSETKITNYRPARPAGGLPITDHKLYGLNFAITGDLSQPRKTFEKLIEDNGGQIQSAISSNTDYLLTNQTSSTSTKFQTAKKLGIKIITEADLRAMLQG